MTQREFIKILINRLNNLEERIKILETGQKILLTPKKKIDQEKIIHDQKLLDEFILDPNHYKNKK